MVFFDVVLSYFCTHVKASKSGHKRKKGTERNKIGQKEGRKKRRAVYTDSTYQKAVDV